MGRWDRKDKIVVEFNSRIIHWNLRLAIHNVTYMFTEF